MAAPTYYTLPAKCQADFCLIPVGTTSPSISTYISQVELLATQSGLKCSTHDHGTAIEGSWTEVMNVIGQAHALIHDAGVQRIYSDVRIGTRTDK
ncbi:YkoF-like protein [Cadophora sp. DSE1049]|nr:YkoF-like protein [Cadophora sp. DSE1049]